MRHSAYAVEAGRKNDKRSAPPEGESREIIWQRHGLMVVFVHSQTTRLHAMSACRSIDCSAMLSRLPR